MLLCTLFIWFLTVVQIINGQECTTRCTLKYSMGQPFIIPDDTQCKRDSPILCEAMVTLDYIRRTYVVHFPNRSEVILSNSDYIQITSGPEFLYTITRSCSDKADDCALRYLKGRISEMIAKPFQISDTIRELSTLLTESPSSGLTNVPLNCYYDTYLTSGNIGPCLSHTGRQGRCLIDYNQWSNVIRSQECEQSDNSTIGVDVYDSASKYTTVKLACKKSLCNSNSTIEEVIKILAKYNLTDASGGMGRGAAKLYRILKPFANRYCILSIWFLAIFNFYLCMKPLQEYAASIGLNGNPTILDTMTYYTPDEGYQTLSNLGDNGRRAYRLTNYAEFVFPILLFLSLSLSNLGMGKGYHYIIGPFLYMIFEYIENLAEKYVLEIYPNRHDSLMNLACYAGLVKQLLKWKWFIIFLSIITILFIITTIVLAILFGLKRNKTQDYQLINDTIDLCTTPYCIKTANYLLESIDETIDPCENFYEFSCGKWIKNARIPEDNSYLHIFETLQTQVIYDIIDLLSTSSINETIELNSVTNVRNLYSSCINESNIERDGINEILSLIKNEFGDWPILQQSTWNESTYNLMNVSIKLTQYNGFTLFNIGQGNLGLEDRSYYINDTKITKSYRQFMRNIIIALNNDISINDIDIDNIFNFEKSIAQSFLSKAQRSGSLFNRTTFNNLSILMNKSGYFNFSEYLRRIYLLGNVTLINTDIIHISELQVLQNISKILEQNSPRIIQNYLIWRFIMNQIDHMPKRFRSIKQEFIHVIKGSMIGKSRSYACATFINKNMGMVISRLYIKKRFDETTRQQAIDMIKNIRLIFIEMINQTTWMETNSKRVAIEKIQLITERIGYPDGLNNDNMKDLEYKYAEYKFNSSYIQNVLLMLQLNVKNSLHKLRESIDRKIWEYILPTDVNAYYRFAFNDITFTAAILQTPFFHKDAPKYLNYGGSFKFYLIVEIEKFSFISIVGIGTIVGHELTHGFDNLGRQFDQNVQINMTVNGKLTLGENIADNGGLKEAFYAYQKWAHMNKNVDKKLPGLTKYSAEQMFFLNFGSIWCSKLTDQTAKKYILTDSHSPTKFRVIGSTSNFAEFDRVFGCKSGQGNSRKNKCVVW
ncbi:hypothetical protein I4U23_017038 [Adineta vaga]|nr:hypothetical protein I4U23_017038 [Adineta vaga]